MIEIVVILLCIALNALFAAFEMAFVSVSKAELRVLEKRGVHNAQALLDLRKAPERTLSVIQVGITLVAATSAAVGGAGAAETIEPFLAQSFGAGPVAAELLAVLIVVLPLTYLNVVVAELVPKSLALRRPLRIVLPGAKWLLLADRLLSPIVSILEWSTRALLKVFFRAATVSQPSEESAVDVGELSATHRQYVLNMAAIEQKQVREFLVPWNQVSFIRNTSDLTEVAALVLGSGHTRLPVVQDSQVIGILHTKEFLVLREAGETSWQPIIRPAVTVHASNSAIGILRILQERRSHMAVVISGTSEPLGIVTIEDILEEVVGDIYDEDDDGRVRKLLASRAGFRRMR